VLAWGDRDASRRCLYNGTGALRLCWLLRCLAAVAALLCAFAASGCTYQLHSLAKGDSDAEPTGAIGRSADQASRATAGDLAYARAAAADVLRRGGKDSSVPWQNPDTGASGNITPLAASYIEGGLPCRDFLASYVHGDSQDWLQGAACRSSGGQWEVKRLKPLNRS